MTFASRLGATPPGPQARLARPRGCRDAERIPKPEPAEVASRRYHDRVFARLQIRARLKRHQVRRNAADLQVHPIAAMKLRTVEYVPAHRHRKHPIFVPDSAF